MLNGVVIDNAKLFNEKLQEWEDFYNYNRPPKFKFIDLAGSLSYNRLRQ